MALAAGEWVTTGSLTGITPARAGQSVTGDFSALGRVTLRWSTEVPLAGVTIMRLRYSPASPFARKALVFAHEKALADRIELVPTDPRADATLAADNPLRLIPVLLADDGLAVFNSPVICEYLELLKPEPRLSRSSRRRGCAPCASRRWPTAYATPPWLGGRRACGRTASGRPVSPSGWRARSRAVSTGSRLTSRS